MISIGWVILIALLAALGGGVLGALLWKTYGPQGPNRDLEQRLKDAEQRLGDYQAEVTEHFVETSRRVNQLTRNYKDVHEYLADSAVKLTTPSVGRDMRAAAQIHPPAEAQDTQDTENPEGQRDRADQDPDPTDERSRNARDA